MKSLDNVENKNSAIENDAMQSVNANGSVDGVGAIKGDKAVNPIDKDGDRHSDKKIENLRNHWSYILEQVGSFIWVILGIFLGTSEGVQAGIDLIKSGHILEGLIAMGIFLLVVFIIGFICFRRWLKTTVSVADGVLTFSRKTMIKVEKNITLTNISNINIERNIFEMIMGTSKLKLDTSSTSEATSTDFSMVFKKDEAENIRNIILEIVKEEKLLLMQSQQETDDGAVEDGLAEDGLVKKNLALDEHQMLDGGLDTNGVSDGSQSAISNGNNNGGANSSKKGLINDSNLGDIMEEFAESDYDVTYSAKDFVLNAIFGTSIVLFAIVVGVIIVGVVGIVTALFVEHVGVAAVLGASFAGIVGFGSIVIGYVKSLEQDVNFRSTRRGDSIFISTGLTTRRRYSIPISKINGIKISSTFLGWMTKRARVDVVNIGGDSGDAVGHRILIYDKIPELMRKLKLLIPEYEGVEHISYERQPKYVLIWDLIQFWGIFIIFIIGMGAGFAAVGCTVGFDRLCEIFDFEPVVYIIGGAIVLIILIFINVCIVLSYNRKGIYYDDKFLVNVTGVFGRNITVVPFERIQIINIYQGPVERWLGYKRMVVNYQGGGLGTEMEGSGHYDAELIDRIVGRFEDSYYGR